MKHVSIACTLLFSVFAITPASAGWVDSPSEDLAHRKWPAASSQLLQWLPDGTWVSIQRCKKITSNAPVPAVDGPMQAPRVWCRVKAGGVWGWVKGSFLDQ